ncbi:hypothetical protein PWT90_06065 [Aphanocladium album]|nr:hypothetical protein PWT90_06065 [Aphanocladium album]
MAEDKEETKSRHSYATNEPGTAIHQEDAGAEKGLPSEAISAGSQNLHRRLGGKEIQLLAIGGAIGTSLFVQMGATLPKGGPAGLFLGFVIYGTVMLCVNQCFAEMITYLPIASPFVRLSGFWVDDALSFAMGWNYFFVMGRVNSVPMCLNGLAVRYFGTSEFYLSSFKVFLMLGLICYTFVTMVGGNPHRDAYGFRYWKNPGSFVEHLVPGDTGRFLGLISCLIQASFTMVGPEFISMAAAEAENPRRLMGRAYRSFTWRLMIFFLGGALCVGIVIPYNDQILLNYIEGDSAASSTGAASPYVISMVKFGIHGLPDLVNVLILTSVLSAGNNVVYSAARTLHGMAMDGKAPAILAKCNRMGVPYYAVALSLAFGLLSLLQLSKSSSNVLDWLVGIVTASYLLNYIGTIITYLHFYASLKAQGVDRNTLPYKGVLQPYASWYALVGTSLITLVLGYDVFIHGHWDTTKFFTSYTMVGLFPIAFVGWKLVFRTKYVKPGTADLQLGSTKRDIDLYESLYEKPKRGRVSEYLNSFFE